MKVQHIYLWNIWGFQDRENHTVVLRHANLYSADVLQRYVVTRWYPEDGGITYSVKT